MTVMIASRPSPTSASPTKAANAKDSEPTKIQQPTTPITEATRQRRTRQRSYNPLTNHTPTRRKEQSFPKQSCLTPPSSSPHQNTDDYDDLEQWAEQIRTELRYTEIAELAMEAERAAEAGYESFTGRPSTFSGSVANDESYRDDDGTSPLPNTVTKKPILGSRAKTFSAAGRAEGGFRRRRSSMSALLKPIGVLSLRPADDVFPSFGSFHSHIRTHLARSHVDPNTLVYDPQPNLTVDEGISSPRRSDIIETSSSKEDEARLSRRKYGGFDSFSHSFSFDRWAHSRSMSSQEGDGCDYLNTLANHLADGSTANRKVPKIEPPPGLELPDGYFTRAPCVGRRRNSDEPHISSSPHQSPTRGLASCRELPSPRSLFDDAEDESNVSGRSRKMSAATEQTNLDAPPKPPQSLPFPPLYPKRDVAGGSLCSNDVVIGDAQIQQSKVEHDIDDIQDNNSIADYSVDGKATMSPSAPAHLSSFLTPARLKDIRVQDSVVLCPQSPEEVESLLLIGPQPSLNEDAQPYLVIRGKRRHASIVLPNNLSGPSDFDLKPRPSSPPITQSSFSDSSEAGTVSLCPELSPSRTLQSVSPPLTPASTEVANELRPQQNCKTPPPADCNNFRSRKVSVLIHGTSPPDQHFVDSVTSPVLQHARLLSVKVNNAYENDNILESPLIADCSCLSLSPCASPIGSLAGGELHGRYDGETQQPSVKPFLPSLGRPAMRRSSSAGALLDLNAPSMPNHWDFFSKRGYTHSKAKGYEAAMSMFSRFSPSYNSTTPNQVSWIENDEFLKNFMYCSKVSEAALMNEAPPCHESGACGEVNMCLCATSFFPDSDLGNLFRGPYTRNPTTRMLSLGHDSANPAKLGPETWFDMANEKFDGVLTQLVGQAEQQPNPWNLLFEAPILKSTVKRPVRASSVVGISINKDDLLEEKKTDDGLNGPRCNDSTSDSASVWQYSAPLKKRTQTTSLEIGGDVSQRTRNKPHSASPSGQSDRHGKGLASRAYHGDSSSRQRPRVASLVINSSF